MKFSSLKKLSFKSGLSVRKSMLFWYRSYRWLLIVLFLGILALGGWNWYESLYRYAWTDAQKKQFLESYAAETDFRAARFEKVIHELNTRKERNAEVLVVQHDLFRLDKILDKNLH